MAQTSKNIGLLDHLGHGNLGDDATLDAVMQNIKSRCPTAAIIGLSLNPSDTYKRHGIPSYPIRRDSRSPPEANKLAPNKNGFKTKIKIYLSKYRFLLTLLRLLNTVLIEKPKAFLEEVFFLVESYRIVKSLDLLIICGGGQLLDSWGGPWSFPYTLLKWTILAKFSGKKCYFLNVGAGPIKHPLSKYFIKHALSLSDYASFRDNESRALVQELGFRTKSEVCADNVYNLDISSLNPSDLGQRGTPIVGISPMIYCDPRVYWEKDQGVYDSFIQKLGLFGSWLVRDHHRLALFSSDIRIDLQAIEDLKTELNKGFVGAVDASWMVQEPILTTKELLSHIYLMDYIVTCRFHGVVFAHLLNKPVMALSHHPKVTALMNDFGLSEYCLDIRTCDLDMLISTFTRLVANRDDIKSRMAAKVACSKNELTIQFDNLFLQETTNQW
jgi:polysaccharide pyruvyl transferase WcaK-like protein